MASSDVSKKRLEAVDMCLEFVTKTLKAEKDHLETTEKVMEDKKTEIEDTKLCLESNKRTVEALKGTLEAVKKSADGDFEILDGVENSLETLKTTVEGGKKSVQNGIETVKGETSSEDVQPKTPVTIGYVDRTVCLRGIEITTRVKEDVGQTVVTDIFKKPLCAVIKSVKTKGDTLKAKEATDKNKQKCIEDCNASGILKTKENTSCSSSSSIIVSLASERNKEQSDLAKKKSVRPKEKSKISNEEFEFAKEKSVRPKELELATGKTLISKEKSKIHFGSKRAVDESVPPKEKSGKTNEVVNQVWKKYVQSNEKSDLINGKLTKNPSEKNSAQPKENFLGANENRAAHGKTIPLINHHPGMDNPFNAMLFSEQLIEYVLNKLGHVWPCQEGARNLPIGSVTPRFSRVIGETMIEIIDSNIGNIAESYKQLVKIDAHKIDTFRKEVCITATFFFCNGYSHRNFLIYAAQLAGLSTFYFASGIRKIADASAQVLAYILNYYIHQLWFYPGSDWFNLHLAAQELRNEIQDRKIIFVLPVESSKSVQSGTENPL